MDFNTRFKGIWNMNKTVCRLIASWCWFAVFVLTRGGDFTELKFGQQYNLKLVLLWAVGNFLIFTLIALIGHPFHTDSWFLQAGATTCVCIWLNSPPEGDGKYLFWLAVTVVYILFTVAFVHENHELFRRWNPGRKTVIVVAVLAAVTSCTIISIITCLRYKTFSSPNFDFGLFVNMFHNMKETGLPLITSERDRLLSHFAVHISPTYYLLLPFYWLFPSPLTLQIGQAVFLMLGIIPVLLLAKHFRLSNKVTIVLSLLYAFYPALSTSCFYDIHENCFLPLFLLLTFYFFESRHPILMYFSALFVLGVKEDAAIYLIIFALYLILSRKSRLHGILLGLLSGGWFLLAYRLLELYGTGVLDNRIGNLIYDPSLGLMSVVKTALVNPGYLLTQMFTTSGGTWDKIIYFCQLFLPLGMLPFCTKKASRWLLMAPLLLNFLTHYLYMYNLNFQYHFGITAFLIYLVILNLPDLSHSWRKSLLGAAAASCLCLYLLTVIPTLSNYTYRWKNYKESYRHMDAILDTIPEDASVSCSTFLLAHIADRSEIYEIGDHKNKPDVDYVVVDTRYGTDWQQTVNVYLAQGYEITFAEPKCITILKKQ